MVSSVMGHFNYKLCFHGPHGKSIVSSSGWSLNIYSMENSGTLSLAMFLRCADTQEQIFGDVPNWSIISFLPAAAPCFVALGCGEMGSHSQPWPV